MQPNALKGLHIAVTRPADQAHQLCAAISAYGGEAIPFPLLAIKSIEDYSVFNTQLTQLEHTDWAIFISSNAVDFSMPHVNQQYKKLPHQLKFAAIGPQTAEALQKFGVQQVLIPQDRFDSEHLLMLPEMQQVAGNTIAIFRGVGGRELMAETLKARGATVYFLESYQRFNPQKNTQLLDQQWQKNSLDAIVVTSSEALRSLLEMSTNKPWLSQVTLCVNHERIAEQARAKGLKVQVAEAPGDAAMLACLSKLAKYHD